MNSAASPSSTSLAVRLRAFLVAHFSRNELELLCLDLHVDPEDVPGMGAGKEYWAAQIVRYFERRGELPELIRRCGELRPDVPWDEFERYTSLGRPEGRQVSERSARLFITAPNVGPTSESTLRKLDTNFRQELIQRKIETVKLQLREIDRVIMNLEEALRFFRAIDHRDGQVNCLQCIGDLFSLAGSPHRALETYQEVLRLLQHQ